MKTQEMASLCKENGLKKTIYCPHDQMSFLFARAVWAAAKWPHARFISVTWLGDGVGAGGQW